jgi:hypothetical protein
MTTELTIGLVLGATAIVAWTIYDPQIELYPGRFMRRSEAAHTLAVWDSAVPGRQPRWVNPDPQPSKTKPFHVHPVSELGVSNDARSTLRKDTHCGRRKLKRDE